MSTSTIGLLVGLLLAIAAAAGGFVGFRADHPTPGLRRRGSGSGADRHLGVAHPATVPRVDVTRAGHLTEVAAGIERTVADLGRVLAPGCPPVRSWVRVSRT